MTRKDYELLARVIREHQADDVHVLVLELEAALAGANASFNRARFLQACGHHAE